MKKAEKWSRIESMGNVNGTDPLEKLKSADSALFMFDPQIPRFPDLMLSPKACTLVMTLSLIRSDACV